MSNSDEIQKKKCEESSKKPPTVTSNEDAVKDKSQTTLPDKYESQVQEPSLDDNETSRNSKGLGLSSTPIDTKTIYKLEEEIQHLKKAYEELSSQIKNLKQNINEKNQKNRKDSDLNKELGGGSKAEEDSGKFVKLCMRNKSVIMQTGIVSSIVTLLTACSIMYIIKPDPPTCCTGNTTTPIQIHEIDKQAVQYLNSSLKTVKSDLEQCKADYTGVKNNMLNLTQRISLVNGTLEFQEYKTITYSESVLLLLFGGVIEMIVMVFIVQKYFLPRYNMIDTTRDSNVQSHSNDRNISRPQPKVLDKIHKVPLDRSICVVSFYEETQNLHRNLVKSAVQSDIPIQTYVVNQADTDLLSIPRSKVIFVFVDFNERNVILENPGQDLGDKKLVTVQAAQKMGADVFVVYFRDKGSVRLPEGDLYNRELTSFTRHFLLKQLTARDRGLSVYEAFTQHQKSHISRLLYDSVK